MKSKPDDTISLGNVLTKVILFGTCIYMIVVASVLQSKLNKAEEVAKNCNLRALKAETELYRLKTAMAFGGIEDFIETKNGTVEVIMIKEKK